MKKLVLIIVTFTLLTFASKNGVSQFDKGKTFYTKGFSLESNGVNYGSITELKFLSDSLVLLKSSVNAESNKIAVEKINSMSFRNGSYGWIGAGVGAVVGTLVGFLWANALTDDENSLETQLTGTVLSPGVIVVSFLGGTLLGGVIGINIGKYDNYYFDKNEKEKADKMKQILKVQR
ncbi:MAG: hypothetical protein WAT71_08155 [Ignavibacteria bacterium]